MAVTADIYRRAQIKKRADDKFGEAPEDETEDERMQR